MEIYYFYNVLNRYMLVLKIGQKYYFINSVKNSIKIGSKYLL